jgi:hypothetical protein
VCERERERKRKREKEREREVPRVCVGGELTRACVGLTSLSRGRERGEGKPLQAAKIHLVAVIVAYR